MKERIFYYDALKAFSIFVVIMGHVLMYSLHETDNILWKFICVVNMSMFMFVSGLLSGKPNLQGCVKRIRTLLLPTLVVGLTYTYIKGHPVPDFFTNLFHYGYWFCFTLFMYYLLIFLVFKFINLIKVTSLIKRCILLWGGVITLLGLSRVIPYENNIVQALSLQLFFKYLPFFAYGVSLNILPKLKEKIESDNYIFTISLIFLFVFTYVAVGNAIGQLIIAFSYVNIMVYFFNRVCKNKKSKIVDYIARRTLDIYLFHFFLLPAFVTEIPSAFNPDTNILITLFVVILLSLIVLAGTLLLTKFIEFSKILSLMMLGKRVK